VDVKPRGEDLSRFAHLGILLGLKEQQALYQNGENVIESEKNKMKPVLYGGVVRKGGLVLAA